MVRQATMARPAALATIEPAGVAVWSKEREDFIRKNFCANAPDPVVSVFLEVAKSNDLRPERKEIYLVPRAGSFTIQTGIDGYRKMAHRTGEFAGMDDVVYDREDGEHPNRATVTVYRMVHGERVPFTATARWAEYCPPDNQAAMWKKMPWLMLGKCAESLALRKAFPSELNAVYTDAEMDQAEVIDAEGRVVDRSTGEITTRSSAKSTPRQTKANGNAAARTEPDPDGPATEEQRVGIRKFAHTKFGLSSDQLTILVGDLNDLTYGQAVDVIQWFNSAKKPEVQQDLQRREREFADRVDAEALEQLAQDDEAIDADYVERPMDIDAAGNPDRFTV